MSLASGTGWGRVPMSQTRPCVECQKPDFGRLYIYTYISEPGSRVKVPEADSRARLLCVWALLQREGIASVSCTRAIGVSKVGSPETRSASKYAVLFDLWVWEWCTGENQSSVGGCRPKRSTFNVTATGEHVAQIVPSITTGQMLTINSDTKVSKIASVSTTMCLINTLKILQKLQINVILNTYVRKLWLSALRCTYMYESGSRVRLGERDSGARLGYISPHTHEWIPACDTLHTDEFDSLEPEPSRTR
jgi:hypothetical protein